MKYVLFYESAEDVGAKAPIHFAAHVAHAEEFRAAGTLSMMGTFEDPQKDGSMAVFATREAAQQFVDEDPFVLNGVVRSWEVRAWNEALTADHDATSSPLESATTRGDD